MTDRRRPKLFFLLVLMLMNHPALAAGLRRDKTEISIAASAEFVTATGMRIKAERDGGMVYEAGWVTKPGWNWQSPYGMPAAPDEPTLNGGSYHALSNYFLKHTDEGLTLIASD